MIFETERLIVRKLILDDVISFHEMQSNPNVMRFADGEVKTFDEHSQELSDLIKKYALENNDFWIYAIEKKSDSKFIGTLALVKDVIDDEIGYRLLEKYWNHGYAFEICEATVVYCKKIGINKLVGYVADENVASVKILERLNFKVVKKMISEDIQLPETKYQLEL
jgi:ribosomal-protein-alanine N-acetyltransferase